MEKFRLRRVVDMENSTGSSIRYHPTVFFDRQGYLRDNVLKALFILGVLAIFILVVGLYAYVSKTSCGQKAEFTGLEATWTWQSGCIYKDEGQIVRLN